MKHSKENLVDLDSDETENEFDFETIQQGNSLEYLDHQIDSGLQKQVLFKFRPAASKSMILSPGPKEEEKYRELDVIRV